MHNQSEMRACELCQLSHAACYDTHLNFSVGCSSIILGQYFWKYFGQEKLSLDRFYFILWREIQQNIQNLLLTHSFLCFLQLL